MAVRYLVVRRGIGFTPGGVRFLVNHGLGVAQVTTQKLRSVTAYIAQALTKVAYIVQQKAVTATRY